MAVSYAGAEGRPMLGGLLGFVLSFAFLLALCLIVIGLFLPAFHVARFWFFTRDVTILDGIKDLVDDGQPVLGWLMLLLSVFIPIGKTIVGLIICSFVRTTGPWLNLLIGAFDFLGKFSFVDVFVVALLVIVLDGRVLTTAQLGPGIYDFAAGIGLSWLASGVLNSVARRALERR